MKKNEQLFTFEDYVVPGTIPVLEQPSSNVCWATVLTMLINWKNKTSLKIESVLLSLDDIYLEKFNNNNGLLGAEKKALLDKVGLVGEIPQSYTIDGILGLLKTHGPLWATTDEDPSKEFSIHARIINGISGDGSVLGTTLHIIDPNGGRIYDETFSKFIEKFEQEARDSGSPNPLRIQMAHF
ncbi:papain-like cysteine protease family protein [Bacillus sp. ME78]|uniref:papain-like cysteine protease family protein n=1 Tax=Bacillus sp. ME78 TaxID=2744261 RepID=UPI0015FEC971|nr:papain-like cysteine protease family protein [Bacillus sp. ME78]